METETETKIQSRRSDATGWMQWQEPQQQTGVTKAGQSHRSCPYPGHVAQTCWGWASPDQANHGDVSRPAASQTFIPPTSCHHCYHHRHHDVSGSSRVREHGTSPMPDPARRSRHFRRSNRPARRDSSPIPRLWIEKTEEWRSCWTRSRVHPATPRRRT